MNLEKAKNELVNMKITYQRELMYPSEPRVGFYRIMDLDKHDEKLLKRIHEIDIALLKLDQLTLQRDKEEK